MAAIGQGLIENDEHNQRSGKKSKVCTLRISYGGT